MIINQLIIKIKNKKFTFLYFLVLFIIGNKTIKAQNDDLGFNQELKKTFIEGFSFEECPEKFSKLEETYLSKVKEMKGYSWEQERFTASVEISETKKVYISFIPSGSDCESITFGRSITFIASGNFLYEENKNEIIDDLLWASKLFCNEEEFKVVNEILNKERVSKVKNKQSDYFVPLFPNFSESDFNSFMAYYQRELDSSRYTILYLFQ